MGDDEEVWPSVEEVLPAQNVDSAQLEIGHQVNVPLPSTGQANETTAEAPQRSQARQKIMQVDNPAELSNRHLSDWNMNYLSNMTAAKASLSTRISQLQARKNAMYWVLDQGIGGVDTNFGNDVEPHPLAIFSGHALLDALTGDCESVNSRKRSRTLSLEGDDEQQRNVRARTEEQEVGRGVDYQMIMDDEEGIQIPVEDDAIESEVGRQAPPSLRDRSSDMPWNQSSRPGSAQPYGSALAGRSSSAGIHGILEPGMPSFSSRRGSRIPSASPLLNKGRLSSRLGSLGPQEPSGFMSDELGYSEIDAQLAGNLEEDFELFGPAAGVSTQQAASNQWLAATLENEAYNFLSFLDTAIKQKAVDVNAADDEEVDQMTFEKLLPPQQNTNVVAAQGLLHVLALATKGLIEVKQAASFGEISLTVIANAAHGH